MPNNIHRLRADNYIVLWSLGKGHISCRLRYRRRRSDADADVHGGCGCRAGLHVVTGEVVSHLPNPQGENMTEDFEETPDYDTLVSQWDWDPVAEGYTPSRYEDLLPNHDESETQ